MNVDNLKSELQKLTKEYQDKDNLKMVDYLLKLRNFNNKKKIRLDS